MTGYIHITPAGAEFVIEGEDEDTASVGKPQNRKRTPQRDALLSLLNDIELWHDPSGDAFATFSISQHSEHRAIRSREFKQWLALTFLEARGGTLGGQAMEDALRVLEARAVQHGNEYQTWLRVGQLGDKLYLDLCDPMWRAVEIGVGGWRVVENPQLKFLRSPAMRPLPQPEPGDCIERLNGFIPVSTEDDAVLIAAWLVAALRVGAPYPILVLAGEQGSGKSFVATLLRSLIDANAAPIRSAPQDDRSLLVQAVNAHVLAFDNLSTTAHWFADALCRMATGSGFSTRRLHTDREEEVFSASRPVILNGIPNLTDRADLADRAIAVHLSIAEASRRPEDELRREFEAAAPGILGAVLDGVSAALRNLPTTKLDRLPRMLDFAKWATAAESGLGWQKGAFIAAYERNRQSAFEDAAEADLLVLLIRDQWNRLKSLSSVDIPSGWEGSPRQLLADLNSIAEEGVRKSRSWPSTPSALGTRIKRAAPTLRRCGFLVETRHSGSRIIRLIRRDV